MPVCPSGVRSSILLFGIFLFYSLIIFALNVYNLDENNHIKNKNKDKIIMNK